MSIKERLVKHAKLVKKASIDLNQFATDDYQNRDGDYPRAGKPDTISVYKNTLEFSFKNTSEVDGKAWVEKFARSNDLLVDKISSWQDGEYQDDWIIVSLKVKID